MANDTVEIVEPIDFHQCDSPRGMMYYDLDILTDEQQKKLNKLKLKTVREDEKYLAAHPEVRAIVALITRLVLVNRPRDNIYDLVARYFSRPRSEIEHDINEYIKAREPHVYEGRSGADLTQERYGLRRGEAMGEEESYESVLSEIDEDNLDELPYDVLNSIVDNAMVRLHINVDEEDEIGPFALQLDSLDAEIRQLIEEEIIDKLGRTASDDIREIIENEIMSKIGLSRLSKAYDNASTSLKTSEISTDAQSAQSQPFAFSSDFSTDTPLFGDLFQNPNEILTVQSDDNFMEQNVNDEMTKIENNVLEEGKENEENLENK